MNEIFREMDDACEAFEAACESMFDPFRPLVFAGVNGGEDPAGEEAE